MSKETRQPDLEFNIGGALIKTCRARDLEDLVWRVGQSGIFNLSLLPLRGLTDFKAFKESLDESSINVVHLEEAWNPTKQRNLGLALFSSFIIGPIARKLDSRSEHPVKWDGLFPDKVTSREMFQEIKQTFPEMKIVSHSIKDALANDKLVEVSRPMLTKSREVFLDFAQENGIALVFDPAHLECLGPGKTISYPAQPTINDPGSWEDHWRAFSATGLVEVVDFRPPIRLSKVLLGKDDYGGLIFGKGKLSELAAAAKEISSVKFFRIGAVLPPLELLGSEGEIKTLSLIAKALKEA